MKPILLSTINARFSHASLGMRWLKANLGHLEADCQLLEFTLAQRPIDMAEEILKQQAKIVGLGLYIWNIELMLELIPLLKKISPGTKLVVGGPEISYLYQETSIYQLVDHLIVGEGEQAFYQLCHYYLEGQGLVPNKVLTLPAPALDQLKYPYHLFSDEDIAHRNISVEASRGCPFGCHFCLSSLDKSVRFFPLDSFLRQLEMLWDRGVRKFKFIDRTFNLPKNHSEAILQFFLEKKENFFLHFEMVPDHFPEKLKVLIEQFPVGSLQFEIGIQSMNPEVAARIGRKQDYQLIEKNLRYLASVPSVHLHTDLIMGLPGETFESIGRGINQLYGLCQGEVQLGILKKLKGAPIAQHDIEFSMCYQDQAPYEVLQNSTLDFFQLMDLKRLARFWDLFVNSGNFPLTLPLLLENTPFEAMIDFSRWIFQATLATHKISLDRQAKLLSDYLITQKQLERHTVEQVIEQDYQRITGTALFKKTRNEKESSAEQRPAIKGTKRQQRHQ